MKKIFYIITILSVCRFSFAQEKSTTFDIDQLKVAYEVYADFHYSYDFNRPVNRLRFSDSNPQFVNQFSFAYGYGQVYLFYKKFQAKAAFHSGEIVDLMYRDEDYLVKFIRELSMTYKINEHIEFESGIFPAVFGAETFINKDNLHATRAVMTDFAPDFETGFRIKYQLGKYWSGIAQMTNGWQVIKENNDSPGFGLVTVYNNPGKYLFNWGIFAGNEIYKSKNATDQFKMYHNIFGRIHIGKKWIIAPMVDIGMIKDPVTEKIDQWESYGGSVRYSVNNKWGVAARYERVHDPNSIINEIITNTPNGFQIHGSTLTLEYLPAEEVTVRLEGRHSSAMDPIFNEGNTKVNTDMFVMLAVAVKLKNWGLVKINKEPGLKDQF
jgi:Putative beta-barrel porin-2, OmpL-like. bbp2